MEMDREPFYPVQNLSYEGQEVWPPSQNTCPKVHVNPNFKNVKSLVIHVNPRMHQKPVIHVNPKMMKDMLPAAKSETPLHAPSVKTNGESRQVQAFPKEAPIQKSIHVNPKLMEKLSSIARADIEATAKNTVPMAAAVPVKLNRAEVHDAKIQSKIATPQRLLAISRRKLVRVGANGKSTGGAKSPGTAKAFHGTSPSISKINPKKSVNPNISLKFTANKSKHKVSAYKIDRTIVERNRRKKLLLPDVTIRNVNKGLVEIGGVMYRSSRTQLVRSGTSSSVYKKRKSGENIKSDTFVMAKNGKKLQRLPSQSKDAANTSRLVSSQISPRRSSVLKRVPSSIVQSSHKNVISYKAKQRSLQILRDKLRKNYIPCLIFRRFGYCANQANGTCTKLHDKKQVALCRNFLQGKCLLDDCPMSHDIGPEKMPTCKYFLEGCCSRDACPYVHVKVSSNTRVCAQFLRGYCPEGSKTIIVYRYALGDPMPWNNRYLCVQCKQRHAYICPEFEKAGKCPKGKHCPYPHKLKSQPPAATVSKVGVPKNARTSSPRKPPPYLRASARAVDSNEDGRKRYYDSDCTSDEQLAEMRASILKKMQIMKATIGATESTGSDESAAIDCPGGKTIPDDEPQTETYSDERVRRPPIGPLPAYIPLN